MSHLPNRGSMIKLVEHFLGIESDKLDTMALQDIALCKLWFDSANGQAGALQGFDTIPDRVKQWLQTADPTSPKTEGRRHQTLLRELIDHLQDARTGSLRNDEVGLLLAAFELTSEAAHKDGFNRIIELLSPHVPTLKRRVEQTVSIPGLPTLAKKLRIIDTSELENARPKEISVLAGIKLPSRGPLFKNKGHLRILGDVPENCTVVIEGGGCVVDGFVMGRIAATANCEVRENISGAVITRNGNIRARNLVNNAIVVSKSGDVHCRDAVAPEIVFGGQQISIHGDSKEGEYFAPVIEISQTALGGTFQVADLVSGDKFKQGDTNHLVIVFRRWLSCKDFGEVPGREMHQDLSQAFKMQERLRHLTRVRRFATDEADQISSNALTYLLGGETIKKLLAESLNAQRRLNVLKRITHSLHSLFVETQNSMEEEEKDAGEDQTKDSPYSSLDELEEDWKEFDAEGSLDNDLNEEHKNISQLRGTLGERNRDRAHLSNMLIDIEARLKVWLKEADTLEERIAVNQREIQATYGEGKLNVVFEKEGGRLETLRKILTAAKKLGEGAVAMRMHTPFVKVMLRSIRSRLEKAEKARQAINELRTEFNTLADSLWENYHVKLVEQGEETPKLARATGRFGRNVTLYSSSAIRERSAKPPTGRFVEITEPSNEVLTFACHPGGEIERIDA